MFQIRMYYRLYRRRNQLYILLGVVLVIIFYFSKNSLNTDTKYEEPVVDDDKKIIASIKRINIQNYVPPPPCGDCPGENGKPVYLTVSYNFLIA